MCNIWDFTVGAWYGRRLLIWGVVSPIPATHRVLVSCRLRRKRAKNPNNISDRAETHHVNGHVTRQYRKTACTVTHVTVSRCGGPVCQHVSKYAAYSARAAHEFLLSCLVALF